MAYQEKYDTLFADREVFGTVCILNTEIECNDTLRIQTIKKNDIGERGDVWWELHMSILDDALETEVDLEYLLPNIPDEVLYKEVTKRLTTENKKGE